MSEKELVKQFISCDALFLKELGINNISLKQEIDIGYGISDIFYFDIPEETINNRKKIIHRKINDKNILEFLLKLKGKKKLTKNHLNKLTVHLTNYSKNKILNFIIDNKIIKKETGNNYYNINKLYLPRFKKSLAIEAKLKNWKRALYQACRYNFVVDRSFVLLPKKYSIQAIKNLNEFKKYNVGLITFSKNILHVVYTPNKNPEKYKNKLLMSYTFENLIFKN